MFRLALDRQPENALARSQLRELNELLQNEPAGESGSFLTFLKTPLRCIRSRLW